MGKHLLAKAYIARLNRLTESEVTELTSTAVHYTTFVILNRQGSRGITIASSLRKFIFDIQVNSCGPKRQTKYSKPAAKDFEIIKFHQDIWNCYIMLEFVSAHIPWNVISNRELGLL